MVELRGDRYYFVGRRGGIINIGGLKVHPEEIEAVINRHRAVRMSRAKSRRSPITGSIVVADVVLAAIGNRPREKNSRRDPPRLSRPSRSLQSTCGDQFRGNARRDPGGEARQKLMRHVICSVGIECSTASNPCRVGTSVFAVSSRT